MNEFQSFLTEAVSYDLFHRLKNTKKPIVIYGMGDGAAKLIYALKSKGISYCDVFASDEFVRGQSFMGKEVKTFSQCQELYKEMIVLVAFSSVLPTVIAHVETLSRLCELYIPDINVYGDPSVVFDTDYVKENEGDLEKVYNLLSNESSRRFFLALIRYKISGRLEDLWQLDEETKDYNPLVKRVDTYCDLGAYTGDTLLEQKALHPEITTALAFEPEPRHCKKIKALQEQFSRLIIVSAAAFDSDGEIEFSHGKGRGSSKTALPIEGLRHAKKRSIPAQSLDTAIERYQIPKVDLIKYDVEGCEAQALKGSLATIQSHHPALIVSLYHAHEDLTKLPLMLKKHLPNARFYLSRKKKCFPAWEVELTIIQ